MEFDELLPVARDFAFNKEKFTTTDLMDALNIGYNRANKLLDELQLEEIVSEPLDGDERILLMNKADFINEISKEIRTKFYELGFLSLSYLKKHFGLDETSAIMVFEQFKNDDMLNFKVIDNEEDFLIYISTKTGINSKNIIQILKFLNDFYITDFSKEIILIKR